MTGNQTRRLASAYNLEQAVRFDYTIYDIRTVQKGRFDVSSLLYSS